MNYKALHRKLKIEKHQPHNKPAVNSAMLSSSFSTSGLRRVYFFSKSSGKLRIFFVFVPKNT